MPPWRACVLLWASLLGCGSSAAAPEAVGFDVWLREFTDRASVAGISEQTLTDTFRGLRPNPRLLRLDRQQSEYNRTFFDYLEANITTARITEGRRLLAVHRALLRSVDRDYGVPPTVLVALWGMETNFGAYMGDFAVIRTLATMAHEGRRRELFESELLAALRLVDSGAVDASRLRGSWAGAMGQPQFMPSTFERYAVDRDGDGRRDIWRSLPDVFASAANYLQQIGWRRGRHWGREVELPEGFDYHDARLGAAKSFSAWRALGVRWPGGGELPLSDTEGSILLPAGHRGPAILVSDNFRVIIEWNRSLHYALAVGILSDRISGAAPLTVGRPAGDSPLPRAGIRRMQLDLAALGFDAGEPDGMVGKQTRAAVREYQRARGLPADGYPSRQLLAEIAAEARGEPRPVDLAELQRQLARLGYEPGPADGMLGSRTRRAIVDYQRASGLPVTGEPSAELVARLALEPGVVGPTTYDAERR